MTDQTLENINWHEVSFDLVNIRLTEKVREHPLVVIESVRKDLCRRSRLNPSRVIARLENKPLSFRFRQGQAARVKILLFGFADREIKRFAAECAYYFSTPGWVPGEVKRNNFKIEAPPLVVQKKLGELLKENPCPDGREICMLFHAPVKIQSIAGKWKGYIEREQLWQLLQEGMKKLPLPAFNYEPETDDFKLIPCYWEHQTINHKSSKEGDQFIGGYTGPLFLKGSFSNLWPYLVLCSEIHAGAQNSFSRGYYTLEQGVSFWKKRFPRLDEIKQAIVEAGRRYDWLAEDQAYVTKSQKPEDYALELFEKLKNGYRPAEYEGFFTEKKSGALRLVEKPAADDLVVQYYMNKCLQPYFDRILENEAVAYRPGYSASKGIELIEAAIKQGYEYFFETDIEDFFPGIDLGKMKDILHLYLPGADFHLRNLLFAFLETGCRIKGKFVAREKGLAQGAVLSPLLANIYLDNLDELIKNEDCRLVRFGDDFVVLTRSLEDAQKMKTLTGQALEGLSLSMNEAKTHIRHISEGFTFMGAGFSPEGVNLVKRDDYRLLKKPLYINQPFASLRLNGESLHISAGKSLSEAFPLRRISCIMLMGNASVSTQLLQVCSQYGIPFTFTYNGYHINTIKPDSKKHFNIAGRHYQLFSNLSDVERLAFARDFAAGKLQNMQTMFRQRYARGDVQFHRQMESFRKYIMEAATIEQIRGFEGAATRQVFLKMNQLLINKDFEMAKRDRYGNDPMNSLLNFGFHLLYSHINAAIRAAGLNPYLGFLHSHNDRYESLAADVQELFRCFVIRMILRLVNLKIILKDDFEINKKQRLYLVAEARKKFLLEFEKTMLMPVGRLSLRDHINLQVVYLKLWATDNTRMEFFTWDNLVNTGKNNVGSG